MGQYNLNRIFKPRHVAVVGASEKAGTIGTALMRNLIDGRFSGTLLPVNPKYKTIHGHECFGSVSALEAGVDLAIIATPIHSVVAIVSECVEKKVGGAIIISALFKVLSPTTIYYRFFGMLKELKPEMLARFTQIDYDREIALVAVDEDSETDRMLGVARIIGDPDGRTGEFAVLVGDAWQGQGIGSNLLEKCLLIAEKQGFESVHGIVLHENRNMLALGKKLGFAIKRDADSGDNELVIHLGGNRP